MSRYLDVNFIHWKAWAGFLCLFILGAGLRLIGLTTSKVDMWQVGTSIAWLLGGLAVYSLSRRMTSEAGALAALAFYYLLPLGILASRSGESGSFVVLWITFMIYGLYRWIERRSWLWLVWIGVCLAAFGFGLVIVDGLSFNSVVKWIGEAPALMISPSFYIRWFERIHATMDLFLVLLSLAAIFLLPGSRRNFLFCLWIGYGIAALTSPSQAIQHDNFHLILIPIVALSLAALVHKFYQEITTRGKAWQVFFTLFCVVAILLSAGYAWNKVLIADEQNAIQHFLKLSLGLLYRIMFHL